MENYHDFEKHLPATGKFIIAQFDSENILIYQGFKKSIAEYAVKHQRFGGADYEFDRITWLKPSFLWMMYYSGWGEKPNQENILAIKMKRTGFDQLLKTAVKFASTYQLTDSDKVAENVGAISPEVQVRWERYFDLFGLKTKRYSAKIGISGKMLQRFNNDFILEITNVSDYVRQQQQFLKERNLSLLQLPHERVYAPHDLGLLSALGGTPISL